MTTRFLHTADWQLGKPFAGIADPANRARVQQARFDVIARLGDAAREHAAEFILVAGDLLDSPSAERATVSAACSALGQLRLPVFVIPGNHDHGGPGGLWTQPFFERERAALAPNLRVLLQPAPVELDTAVLLPCPLLRRAESTDLTAWLRSPPFETDAFAGKPRLVLAHGSVQDFGGAPDDDDGAPGTATNHLALDRLPPDAYDYIALGDWHGCKQVGPRAWYAGTPELDRFPKGDANQPGHVLAVTAHRGADPAVTPVRTALLGWHELTHRFAAEPDLAILEQTLTDRLGTRTGRDLLRLELDGRLDFAGHQRLTVLLETLEARLLRLKLINRTSLAPTEAELRALTERTTDPLIASVASRLVADADSPDPARAALARTALAELHAVLAQA